MLIKLPKTQRATQTWSKPWPPSPGSTKGLAANGRQYPAGVRGDGDQMTDFDDYDLRAHPDDALVDLVIDHLVQTGGRADNLRTLETAFRLVRSRNPRLAARADAMKVSPAEAAAAENRWP
jgi:hypothetical protein